MQNTILSRIIAHFNDRTIESNKNIDLKQKNTRQDDYLVTCKKQHFTICGCNSPVFYLFYSQTDKYKHTHWIFTIQAFFTDLGSDAVSSWSTWSLRCSRYRQSSCPGSPASVPWPPLFPAPSKRALWCPSEAPAPPGRTPPPLRWMLHLLDHPAPACRT